MSGQDFNLKLGLIRRIDTELFKELEWVAPIDCELFTKQLSALITCIKWYLSRKKLSLALSIAN